MESSSFHCVLAAAVFIQNLSILIFSLIHVNFRLLFVCRTDCTRSICSFLIYAYRVLFSDIDSAHLRHRDLSPCHRPWRLRIGSPSLARKSLHHNLIDLNHDPPDVSLPPVVKDKYLNFGALVIKRPSLRPLHGDTTA